uniref:VapE domain-containing protein n=1 Tax=Prevotella sp. TaxID=59823 RepID=UPI003FEE1295
MKENLKTLSSSDKMTNEISALSLVESFLDEYYLFRRNVLSGKTEYFTLSKNEDETEEPVEEEPETGGEEEESSDSTWKVLTPEAFNSIVRHAKRLGVGGKKSPRQDIEEFVRSEEVPEFDPIREYLENLPEWDGKNHVAELFGRIPGLTSEQLGWCATWLRSAVAHWLQMDMFHGNETTPVLIGKQGCGKSTFAYRLLPDHLRQYFLDHINFANKFDSEMALTHNLYVNIDEFANMGPSQQGKLKQMLSKVKVNGRPIFGKSQDDRPRYASFLATTNDEHPLCDPTGSRRFVCLHIPAGEYIDNGSPIIYDQLYAQVMYELCHKKTPYWFTNAEVDRIQKCNLPFFKVDDFESMLKSCFRVPEDNETGEWLICSDVFEVLHERFPMLISNLSTKIRIGQSLKLLGCKMKHTKKGQAYLLVRI